MDSSLRISALVSLAMLLGCSGSWIAGSRAWFDEGARVTLGRRAGFDLSCPEQQLAFSPLGSRTGGSFEHGDYTTVGVVGCGTRATYVNVHGEWVMNSNSSAESLAGTGRPHGKPPSATAAALLKDIRGSKAKVVISERKPPEPGLGKIAMSVDGTPVWPPRGEDCGALVSCCNERQAADDRFALLCQFAVVRDGQCLQALRTVSQVASELNQPVKGACRTD